MKNIAFFKDHWLMTATCAVVLCGIVRLFFLPYFYYKKAVASLEAGDYAKAFELFDDLGDYKDSVKQAEAIKINHSTALLKLISTGNIISFGTYEQDNNIANGPEDIEWIVLAEGLNEILVISRYALDCKIELESPYSGISWNNSHWGKDPNSWERNRFRAWLNDTFLDVAFTPSEQAKIKTTKVYTKEDGDKSTSDKIFLLSLADLDNYFLFDADARCEPTRYANSRGCLIYDKDNPYCDWWLRSHSSGTRTSFKYVNHRGSVDNSEMMDSDAIGIRPVMWIQL